MGFEVGLGKWANSDVVAAVRPIFLTAKGAEVLGRQHGGDTSRLQRVKAKPGYAVGAITAKAAVAVDGFSVTFMRIDNDRLDPKEAYESEWMGGKGNGPQTRLGGDGALVVGIVGKENSRDCTGLGLLQAAAGAEAALLRVPRRAPYRCPALRPWRGTTRFAACRDRSTTWRPAGPDATCCSISARCGNWPFST